MNPWITEHNRHNVCDIVWWLKGYMAAAKDSFDNCPFTEDHQKTLSAIAEGMRDTLFEEQKKK